MSELNVKLRLLDGFLCIKPAQKTEIDSAESKLGLRFSDEYREYLSEFGVVTVSGHEFTGISTFPRLGVVEVTTEERGKNPGIPHEYYVIEKADIDGVIVWQSSTGEVFQTAYDSPPEFLCKSMLDYITQGQ